MTINIIKTDIIRKLRQNRLLKLIITIFLPAVIVMWQPVKIYVYGQSEIKDNDLYALSACLMDADSGRVLYEKNGYDERAMASTTKIMTLIVALENVEDDLIVKVSEEAASQPKVKLGMNSDEEFYIGDLYYSLMLESHNDTAFAIAQGVSGSVEEFAKLMNKKAREIGAYNTYFITPNGLDATDESGKHHTTAVDLAKIMSYCINESPSAERFIEITRTSDYTFTDISGEKSYSVYNHNAFLNMMEGVISGKTGFTSEAGYCYVCALEDEGRRYVVSLLGCGWPSNKNYKWSDTRRLMEYGIDNYEKNNIYSDTIIDGTDIYSGNSLTGNIHIDFEVEKDADEKIEMLICGDDFYKKNINIKKDIMLPVKKGEIIGNVVYYLNNEVIAEYDIYILNDAKKTTFADILKIITGIYFCKNIVSN